VRLNRREKGILRVKSYTTFKDPRGVERAFRVYGYRYGRKIEILLDPDNLRSEKLVIDLGRWLMPEGFVQTAIESVDLYLYGKNQTRRDK
jgi:hypothetical protein